MWMINEPKLFEFERLFARSVATQLKPSLNIILSSSSFQINLKQVTIILLMYKKFKLLKIGSFEIG